jgi:hypothetical protein
MRLFKIMARLKPYLEKMTDKPFREVVGAAYMDRVSLVATGFYKMEGITFDPVTRRGGRSKKMALRCPGPLKKQKPHSTLTFIWIRHCVRLLHLWRSLH